MTTTQQAPRTAAAVRVAEISLSVLIGGIFAAVSYFLLIAVASPVAPILIAAVLGVLSAVAADIALRSFRTKYLS